MNPNAIDPKYQSRSAPKWPELINQRFPSNQQIVEFILVVRNQMDLTTWSELFSLFKIRLDRNLYLTSLQSDWVSTTWWGILSNGLLCLFSAWNFLTQLFHLEELFLWNFLTQLFHLEELRLLRTMEVSQLLLSPPHLLILHSCHIVPLSILPDLRKQWPQLAIISFSTCNGRDLHKIAHILHNIVSVTSAVWAMLKQWQLSPLHLLSQCSVQELPQCSVHCTLHCTLYKGSQGTRHRRSPHPRINHLWPQDRPWIPTIKPPLSPSQGVSPQTHKYNPI